MSSYALIENGKVSNIILWDGEGDISLNKDVEPVLIKGGDDCKIGWSYEGGEFISPKLPEVPALTKDEYIDQANKQKQSLISSTNQSTQLLQTQLLLGMITDTDKAALVAWMGYVQKLQALDTSTAPGIDWPDQPK